jgi:hypothetical protein
MPSDSLERVQQDLSTLRAALNDELPCDGSHVLMNFLGAVLALPLLMVPLFGWEAYLRPVAWGVVLILACAWSAQLRYLRARRAEAPALWRWSRKEMIGSLVAIVLLVGFIIYVAAVGTQRGNWDSQAWGLLGGTIFFLLGTFSLVWIAIDRPRWPGLGWAVTLLAAGALMPWCDARERFLLLGAILGLGGLSSGLLQWWQLRRMRVNHGA